MSTFGRIDVVHALDCWQTRHEDAERCPNPDHGKLWSDASGTVLICPCGPPGKPCGYQVRPSVELIAKAYAESKEPRDFGIHLAELVTKVKPR